MRSLDDLKQAGFSDDEVQSYATQQRQTLSQAGFSDDEINEHLGTAPKPAPDLAGANKTFARTFGDAITGANAALEKAKGPAEKAAGELAGGFKQTTEDIGSVYAPIEAALNAGTGLLFGFPASITAAAAGLTAKHVLGMDVDPKEWMDLAQKYATYQPQTERGQRLAGNVMMPLQLLAEGAGFVGHKATDVATKLGASTDVAAGIGAVTDSTIQMLAPSLLLEFGRKMSGQTVTAEDMANVSKVVAGPDAAPEVHAAVEQSLRTAYEKTGIGPFTIAEEAAKNPALKADLMDPKVDLPKTLEEFVPKAAKPEAPVPGDGLPLLDTNGSNAVPHDLLAKHGLDDATETRAAVMSVSEAAKIDPEAVQAAATAHADNEPAFHKAIQEIINGQEAEQGASLGERGAGAVSESGTGQPEPGNASGGARPEPVGSDQEQPSSASKQPGSTTLNAGFNPAQVLADVRDGYSAYVGVEADHVKPPMVDSQGKPVSRFMDDIRRVLAPASRGEIAEQQAGIMRANFGEMAHENELAQNRLFDFAKTFDKMPVEENVKFIDAYEHGTALTDPKLAAAAQALRDMNDGLRTQIQGLGKGQLENFDENYLGRIWKDPETANRDLYARRPLEGNKNFLKARTIPYYVDGLKWRAYDSEGEFVKSFDTEVEAKMAAGTDGRVGAPLQPITTNPVEMALLKGKEMRKYIYGQKIFGEMKDADLARFVSFGQQALPGWTKINDKIANVMSPADEGGMIQRGNYYAPDEAATLLNNHLSSGLQGNSFFDAWRGASNAINGLQLGLSAFHVGFTSMDAIISKATLGIKQISRGDIGEGLGNIGMSLTGPVQSINNLLKGDRLLRAYNGDASLPELSPLVDAIQQAGGRVKMDDFYRNEAVNTFRQALRNQDYPGAAKAFLPTVLDRIGAPIFEQLVPRQKLGVFADMAQDWLDHNPDAELAERRAGLGKLWDSVDNRMGQLVYDNVFWNRALKDGLMATVRSVGWNLGTFRELGGGLLDIKDIAANKGFSDRTAYVVALPMVAAIYGSVMHYAYNGTAPEDLKDAFYPRTGRTRPDGSPDRVSLPTYMKDVFAYGEDAKNFVQYGADPTQTLKNKANPLISTISQMLNNQDYFGGAIRNPADSAVKQIMDEAAFLISQVSPFSLRNYQQQAKEKGEEPSVLGYLTSPSMIGVTPAPGYMVKTPEELESSQVSRMREPLIQKYREAIKAGGNVDELIPEMIKGGLSRRDIQYVIKSSGDTPKPHRLKKFGSDTQATSSPGQNPGEQ